MTRRAYLRRRAWRIRHGCERRNHHGSRWRLMRKQALLCIEEMRRDHLRREIALDPMGFMVRASAALAESFESFAKVVAEENATMQFILSRL